VWPAFSPAVLEHPISSLFAFPLVVGSLRIGAVDMYSAQAMELTSEQSKQAVTMANAVGRLVLRRALDTLGGEYDDVGNAHSRRLVHQATGVVIAQLRMRSDDARLVIQGQAFATGRPMMEVALDIVEGRLSFSQSEGEIEVSQ
jgi:hypothetical protein